jgi:hypothetical protein
VTLKIAPTDRIDWPPPYRETTEKYSAQVKLSPDHRNRSLIGYVAGEPFPLLDPNDPENRHQDNVEQHVFARCGAMTWTHANSVVTWCTK